MREERSAEELVICQFSCDSPFFFMALYLFKGQESVWEFSLSPSS